MTAIPTILQVVPAPPPDGVGSYAAALGEALAAVGVAGDVFSLGAPPTGGDVLGAPPTGGDVLGAPPTGGNLSGAPPTGGAFARQLAASGAATVLLHYVNYAYQRRGCPGWLVGGALAWRRADPRRRLVTYFHEVYASGPPWRSSFWTLPWQKGLAARLLRASDAAATSLPLYGEILQRWRPAAAPWVTPVFSTVGEPGALGMPPTTRRPRLLAIFGGAGTRRRAYLERRGGALAAACAALDIEEIVDIGPPLDPPPLDPSLATGPALPAPPAPVPVRQLGPLPAAEISAALGRCAAGFMVYPTAFLAKSTVFAAYCAHGLLPVCAAPAGRAVRRDQRPPSWDPSCEERPADLGELAGQAAAWYRGHDLMTQALRFRTLLEA